MITLFMLLSGILAKVVGLFAGIALFILRGLARVAVPNHHRAPDKRRHPHQVMRWEDLELGRKYTTVYVRGSDGKIFEYERTFAGAFSREPKRCELPRKSGKPHYENMKLTIHLDGWTAPNSGIDTPSIVTWGGDGKINTSGRLSYFLSGCGALDHKITVPTDRWNDSPKVTAD